MEFGSLTQTAFLSATLFSLIFFFTCVYQASKKNVHWSFPLAALIQTLWLATISFHDKYTVLNYYISWQASEAIHVIAWILALLLTTRRYCNQKLPLAYVGLINVAVLACASLFAIILIFDIDKEYIKGIICWQGIGLAIIGLLSVEQLYRNISNIRLIKLLCINLAIMFIFDAWLFSQSILDGKIAENMWQARAAVSLATSALMAIGTITLSNGPQQTAKITVSRPI